MSTLTERVERIEFTVPYPPGHAAAFLIDGDEPVLVDAGHHQNGSREELDDGLASAGYTVDDIDHVLTTHPHTDHIGQVPALLSAGATLAAPRAVCDQLDRDTADLARGVRETTRTVGLDEARIEAQVDRAVHSLERNRELLPPDEVTTRFEYGERFSVADLAVESVHTPGHQVGHACFVVQRGDERVLFSGDALIATFRAAALNVGLDHGAYEAVADFRTGYGRLDGVVDSVDRVYPGHGPVFDDAPEVLSKTRERLNAMVADVERAVAAVGPASPQAVTEERVGQVEYPAPLLDTVGALGTLVDEERVRYETDERGVRRYRPV